MSPEQVGGQPVDARCDLFSLGCVLYLMATGELPFKGQDTLATLVAVTTDEPPPPRQVNPEVPAPLSQLIVRLLAKKPADRPASARAVAEELARIERAQAARRQKYARALLTAAAFLALIGGGVYLAAFLPRGRDKPGPSENNPTDSGTTATVNLLPLIDPDKDVVIVRAFNQDVVRGRWSVRNGELRVEASRGHNVIEVPYRPPEEYDLRGEFTRLSGGGDVSFALSKDGRSFQWCAAVENNLFGFNMIDNQYLQESPFRVRLENGVRNGQRHVAVVQVRRRGLKAFLDDRLVNEVAIDGSNLSMFVGTRLRDDRLLGLSTWQVPAVFHRIEVVEIRGTGTRTRPAPDG
jgi:hypothetical protein